VNLRKAALAGANNGVHQDTLWHDADATFSRIEAKNDPTFLIVLSQNPPIIDAKQ
jgi:hypothetical protein